LVVGGLWRKAVAAFPGRHASYRRSMAEVEQGLTDLPGSSVAENDQPVPRALPLRLTRHFAVVCGVALIAAAALLSLLFGIVATRELVETAEHGNVAVTTLFQTSLLRASPRFAGGLVEALRSPSGVAAMGEEVIAHMRDSPVVKVKVYDAKGLTIFSTEPGQTGENKLDDEGVVSALAGTVASELTYRDSYSSFESRVEHADLVSSYIPIRQGGLGSPVLGVFEIYSNVSSTVALIARAQILMTAAVLFIFALVYGGLVWAVGRSDRVIRRQHDEAVAMVPAGTASRAYWSRKAGL
jgi:hypothetical protein